MTNRQAELERIKVGDMYNQIKSTKFEDDKVYDNFSRNLTYLMNEYHLTQGCLAKIGQFSPSTIRRWMKGKGLPSIIGIYRISAMFRLTMEDMITKDIRGMI